MNKGWVKVIPVFDGPQRRSCDGMRRYWCVSVTVAACLARIAFAQDLAPRAYIVTPIHINALSVTYSFFDGNLDFQGAVPITDATAKANVPIISLYHSFNLLNRSANFTIALPYGEANFRGDVMGSETNVYRSGLFDTVYRVSVNLVGGPAMAPAEFRKWRQKDLIGVSLRVTAPTGQYDSTKLINFGTNRWGFKPEVGYSRRRGHWIVDAYFGAWFYTKNPKFFSENQFYPGVQSQTQAPVGAFEGHLSYDVRPRLWVSLDANYWFGGKTSLNGVENPETALQSSRIGTTASVPISKHQSIKISFSNGAYIKYGGDYKNVSVAWQYSWLGHPK